MIAVIRAQCSIGQYGLRPAIRCAVYEGPLWAESRPANPSSLGSKPQIVTLTGRINWDRFRDHFNVF